MKVLTDLQAGTVAETPNATVSGIAWVAHEAAPGVILKMTLHADGLTIQRPMGAGDPLQVRVPLAELLRLAQAAEPGMAPEPASAPQAGEVANG